MRSDPPSGPPARRSSRSALLIALAAVIVVMLAGLLLTRLIQLESRVDEVAVRMDEAVRQVERVADNTEAARKKAEQAEEHAREAAQGRLQAETERERAAREAEEAREDASYFRFEAEQAREEAEQIRREREEELNRLHRALSRFVETRRTAMGLLMNLGSDAIQFDFDKAEIRPANRELLARIAGILLTSTDFRIDILGHTDDVGSAEYNIQLSERRARAVREYLVEAGLDESLISTTGHGKERPLVEGADAEARAKNRRVEIAIVSTNVDYRGAIAVQ
jgi:outer membrane protein OmpA-like peptidoglycan-associated protein